MLPGECFNVLRLAFGGGLAGGSMVVFTEVETGFEFFSGFSKREMIHPWQFDSVPFGMDFVYNNMHMDGISVTMDNGHALMLGITETF